MLPRYSVEDLVTRDQAQSLAEEAVESGRCPFSRGKVQIIGDARTGQNESL